MLTFAQAARMSNDPVLGAIFKGAFTKDKLLSVIPWARVQGKGHTYLREGTQITAAHIGSGGAITAAAQTVLRVTANLQTIAASAQIPGDVLRSLNDNFDQAQVQIAALSGALARKLRSSLVIGSYPTVTLTRAGLISGGTSGLTTGITAYRGGPYLKPGVGSILLAYVGGSSVTLAFRAATDITYGTAVACTSDTTLTLTSSDGIQSIDVDTDISVLDDATGGEVGDLTISSSSNEFDGLKAVVTNTVSMGTNGAVLSLAKMREAVDAVDPEAGQKVIALHSRTMRSYKALLDALGGTHAAQIELQNYGIGPVPAFEGEIPMLVCDYLPITETQGTTSGSCASLYVLSLAEPTGATSDAPFKAAGICGLYSSGVQADTAAGPTMGLNYVVDKTPRDGNGLLLDAAEVAVMGDFALASYSTKASCRLLGITN
jgi:hypothetical protein